MQVGDRVIKTTGDYTFSGIVVSVFAKTTGAIRYVVENEDGILHIFSGLNIRKIEKDSQEEHQE